MAIGRISGQLLKDNLIRDGKDLTFDNDLLHLDVTNRRIGINTLNPSTDLQVNGTIRGTNYTATAQAVIDQITISSNQIVTSNNTLNLLPNAANAVVIAAKMQVDNLELTGNNINALGTNTSINLNASGTGRVNINSSVLVNGSLHATGSITADGNLTLGDNNTDSIAFNADIISDIRPDVTDQYSLGSSSNRWLSTYSKNVFADAISTTTINANGINLILSQGNTYYVATNGQDTKTGTHQNDPFASLTKALSVATAGSTIYIYPGTYVESFPLTVPVGVTIRGAGLRSVTIQPTAGTRNKDCFLIDGEVTIEDLSISGFEYNSVNNTGHAFRLKTGFKVTTRSPYIRNVSVITSGSTVRLGTNPVDDPKGYLAGDAGRGAYFSGSVANSTSKDVSVLFHSVTFITPGVDCMTVSNGVKIEWLNSFIYFAAKGFNILTNASSAGGQYGTAQVGLKIPTANRTGTWNTGNTVTYYDTDGTTVLATGIIASVSGDWVYITGYQTGFATITDRPGKTVYAQGSAQLSATQKKWGSTSLYLNNTTGTAGASAYVTASSSADFGYNSGNYTIEAWVYPTSTSTTNQIIVDQRWSSASDIAPILYLSSSLHLFYSIGTSVVISGATPLTLNNWHHIAVARNGTSTKLYLNGNQVGSTYTGSENFVATPLTIGTRYNAINSFAGYIDDLKISKGVAKYTGSTYTVPSAALTSDLDTVLMLHFNGVAGSTIFADDGVTLQDVRTSAGGTGTLIAYADYTKFGAEVRAIGSAHIYGTYGFAGDGPGCIAYLISQNFSYVGSGRFSTNDPSMHNPANQVIKTNGAKIYYTSVDNDGDFKVGDFFEVNQKTGEVTFSGSSFNIPSSSSITLTNGVDTTVIDATKVQTGNILISGNTISTTTGDLVISPSSGSIVINSNTSLVIPKGTTAQRPSSPVSGMLRFNTDSSYNWFEGYNGSNWIPLGQVTDIAKTTYIKAEATPGIGDKTLYFYADSTQVATLTTTAFTTNKVNVGNLSITNNTVTPVTPNTDIVIQPTGTGGVQVGNIKITTNTITNTQANSTLTLQPTGTGYVRVTGPIGMVIPSGVSSDRPATPEQGMMRYNTEVGQTEIYVAGSGWVSVTGTSGSINVTTANDISLLQALIFG